MGALGPGIFECDCCRKRAAEQKGPPPKRSKQDEEKEQLLRVSMKSERESRVVVVRGSDSVCACILSAGTG